MGFSCGIIGLPNAGKSTIFNALTASSVPADSYPFCTIDPNTGVVEVPDNRLQVVQEFVGSPKAVPTVMEFVDIAGLVEGASKGEGLGNQFLSHIRGVDAVAQVVRAFESGKVAHVRGSLDPLKDWETVEIELILSDLELVEKHLSKVKRLVQIGNKERAKEAETLEKVVSFLEQERFLPTDEFSEKELALLKPYQLLTLKPRLCVLNVGEDGEPAVDIAPLLEKCRREGVPVVTIRGQIEAELAQMDPDEQEMFRNEMGIEERGLDSLIKAGYSLLDLITFFTGNEKECRAWTIKKGTPVVKAAGKIHTDMEEGFVKAEVISFKDLEKAASIAVARDKGLMRIEGKDYEVQDGDLVTIRFTRK